MKHILTTVIVVLATLLGTLGSEPVFAAAGPQCSNFTFQEDAQSILDQYGYAESLDLDGDGVACDELPAKPKELAGAISGRIASMDDDFQLIGVTEDKHFRLTLAGVAFAGPTADCGVDPVDAIESMFPPGNNVFFFSEGSDPIQEVEDGYRLIGSAWLYGIEPDGVTPYLLNERAVELGLGRTDNSGLDSPLAGKLTAAEVNAKTNGTGIWGSCETPDLAPAPTRTPYGQIIDWKGSGDQVSAVFSISADGTYRLTANGSADLLFVDLYDQYGNWLPGFSISARGGGVFSSGGFLPAGQYYVQVQASGVWWITIEPLA